MLQEAEAAMNVEIFNFRENQVREITDQNGEPWFVAKDIAEILGYSETAMMTRRLDEDEVMSAKLADMNMNSTLINESGMYNAIIGSKKPTAKAFRKWVTSEVLPSIRKAGGYLSKHIDFSNPDNIQMILDQWKKDRSKLEEVLPKAELADKIIRDSKTHHSITDSGKLLGIRQSEMFRILRQNKLITSSNLPTQKALDYGVLKVKEVECSTGFFSQAVMTVENIAEFKRRYL